MQLRDVAAAVLDVLLRRVDTDQEKNVRQVRQLFLFLKFSENTRTTIYKIRTILNNIIDDYIHHVCFFFIIFDVL